MHGDACVYVQTLEEIRKKLAVLDNELSKEKGVSRRYQVAVERLMQFVEVAKGIWQIFRLTLLLLQNCHEVLVKSPDVDRVL